MPRIRSIYPSFVHDSKVKRLSRDARLTFLLMLPEADDEGRMPGSGKWLAGALYEDDDDVTPAKVLKWVGEMIAEGMVAPYEVDGARYLAIVKFKSYQHPKNPTPSRLPSPPTDPPPDPPAGVATTPATTPPATPATGEAATPLELGVRKEEIGVSLSSTSDSRPPLRSVPNGTPPDGGGEGKSQVNPHPDPFVERIVAKIGHRRCLLAAIELVARWRSILDARLIDQAIGMCEQAEDPPRSVAYFERALRETAAQHGVHVPQTPAASEPA